MDSHRVHRFGVSDAGISYTTSALTPPTVPEGLFGTAKSNTRKSPNTPFSTTFDRDATASQSDSAEQQSSTESLPGASASCNSSFESNSCCYRLSGYSLDSPQKSSFASTSGAIYAHNPNGGQSLRHALTQLETPPMGPGNEDAESKGQTMRNQDPQHSHVIRSEPVDSLSLESEVRSQPLQEVKEEALFHGNPSGNLKQLLFECARALSDNRLNDFEQLVEEARSVVSISGDPLQRLGAYMIEGMVARKESSGTSIYHSLRCKEPLGKELLSYMHILYEICPYLKFGYMAANGAIAEACRNENSIHIIDFQIAQGTQWMTLLQALAARPGGPPHVRITGIDDPVSKYARGTCLDAVGKRLAAMSEKFNIPVEFHAVPVFAPQVTQDMLQLRPNEALAVNFPLQLHHTPDESVDVENPRDGLLRMVKSLSPKVTTLVEQESNTNTTPFLIRFAETLDYYSAMFESIDVTMARDRKERISVEQHCLAKDIVNIIACEGKERVERHELLGKWKSRFTMAGFRQYPLSSYVNSVIKGLLKCYSEHYSLVEKDGAMLLGWKNRMLISASAWH